jgi:vacuolar-type H+-ATPase subunit I/STV1
LVDAKEKAKEIELAIENLLKQQCSLSRSDIKDHNDKFLSEIEDMLDEIEQKHKEIIAALEAHRKKLSAKERFLRRHYSRR